jgi:hypothetical protein
LSANSQSYGKKDPPPPPPPRPKGHGHARSSSLDLNKVIVRSSVANDLTSTQIPSHLKISNSEYGLTAPNKGIILLILIHFFYHYLNNRFLLKIIFSHFLEFPAISLNSRNLGAFVAYKKTTKQETSLTSNSFADALMNKFKIPPEVPIPK